MYFILLLMLVAFFLLLLLNFINNFNFNYLCLFNLCFKLFVKLSNVYSTNSFYLSWNKQIHCSQLHKFKFSSIKHIFSISNLDPLLCFTFR